MTLLLFLSPIFFPVEALPADWRVWIWLNPLILMIDQTRAVLMDARWPDWGALSIHLAVSTAIAALGAAFFRAVRGEFSDVV